MSPLASEIRERLAAVRARIAAAAQRANRDPEEVRVLAVSKTFPASTILATVEAGLFQFGENRVQEAARKVPPVRDASPHALEFHLIGSLQRNKARRAAELFDVIQSVDRPELARSLNRAAAELGRRLQVMIQVNIDAETQKGGVEPSAAPSLAELIGVLPQLDATGLMAIPAAQPNAEIARKSFSRLRRLHEQLKLDHPGLRELSMGMSADFEVAIEEGATWIRIGTGLFGPRTP